MKLATLKTADRDGSVVVVNRELTKAKFVPDIALTLQEALDNWAGAEPRLQQAYQALNEGEMDFFPFDACQAAAPLPRAYQWLDGSAYLSHVERVRKARGADLPKSLLNDPLMYQGASDIMLGACDPIETVSEDWGIDFEAEVGVITDDVELGISCGDAASHIKLIVLINDVSLRRLIPDELAKGFGFLHGKPASAFSPVAVTPDELGAAWNLSRLHLPLTVHWNGKLFGHANAGTDMQFNFARLIAHAAKTRKLSAGTIIGSGTVSNYDSTTGYSCIVEKRVVEIVETGKAVTGFMHFGDQVRIEMLDEQGHSVFGAIEQEVRQCR
ncbi:Fumarylacetoacetate (FAA) hydrolase [Candidatus Methylobacter favarea]|uniref:Fumarylacetoacetate (FAA) hydrolase n=1 Tax=Candidatus Methylobacter favarea TaxID=2707345 RepID=A0A8S0XIR6_9GAMM|nr:fumarylacetoacetate hydrolase family protein [Candidatus Methylobacter favarea]CAA9892653.1 Fumarylacetoacetate (FAA) hydrolase [Candidatus Methylobacter favarea]